MYLSTTSARAAATILVIDDQAEVRSGLAAVLSAAGHRCHAAADERSALDLAARIHPDLILCDINLQGVNGIELCGRLKQLEGLADVPTMFLSGTQTPDIIRRAHAYYIRKLLDPQVILQLVEQALAEIVDRHLAHA
jgi:CheY-like chemotaxis protein